MGVKRFAENIISKTKIGKRIAVEHRYRVMLFAAGALIVNIAYAVYHGFLGIAELSVWFITMSAYYTILGIIRFSAVLYEYKNSLEYSYKAECFVMKISGALLVVLGIVLTGIVYISLSQNIVSEHGTVTMVTIAAYTFGKISVSVIKAIKQRGQISPVLAVIKNIRLAEAAVSVFTLQRSMIASFGGMKHAHIMNILTGAVICLFVISLGIVMIIQSIKEKRHEK